MQQFLTTESLIIALLLIASLVAIAVRRLHIQYTVALVVVGLLLTTQSSVKFELTPELIQPQSAIVLANPLSSKRSLVKACKSGDTGLSWSFAIQPTRKTHDINTASTQDVLEMRFASPI
jgi:hypothetical protein